MKHMWTAVQGVDVSLTLVTGGKRTLGIGCEGESQTEDQSGRLGDPTAWREKEALVKVWSQRDSPPSQKFCEQLWLFIRHEFPSTWYRTCFRVPSMTNDSVQATQSKYP
jgi:hypothetical protein